MKLGGGRETKEDIIDPNVGIKLHKKIGDFVNEGDVLCDIYKNKPLSEDILPLLDEAYKIVEEKISSPEIIKTIIN